MKKFLLSSVLMLVFAAVSVSKTNAQCASVLSQAFSSIVSGSNVTYSFSITFPQGNASASVKFYCPDGTLLGTVCYANRGAATLPFTQSYPIGSCSVSGQYYITVQAYTNPNCGGNACGSLVQIPTPGPLPVTLANFNAAQRSNKVTLTWETTMELDNDGFEIERRIGAGAYQKIAFVDSKAPGGNGAEFAYSFEDNTVLPKGVSYYRLRQVDFDGRATYSEIKAVRTGNGTIILSVYPNPSRGTTNVALPAGVGTYDVSLDDFTGKSVQRFSGLTTNNLQLNNLKPGIYMLRVSIRATGETITERIAVQ